MLRRKGGEFVQARPEDVELMDVSPNQLVSVAASLIPFLENDDANRALMGSNMQRQAVPLLRTFAPLVGTGIEGTVARDSGVCTLSPSATASSTRSTPPASWSSAEVPASSTDVGVRGRHLQPHQVPALQPEHLHQPEAHREEGRPGEEGRRARRRSRRPRPASSRSARTWSSRSCRGRATTSRTRSSSPSASSRRTSSPPSTSRSSSASRATPSSARKRSRATSRTSARRPSRTSTSRGIIRIGAEVKPGDILVGKITPKGETQLSPEEKLLRAIFGEKAGDVRDSSLRVPPGVHGTVINAKVFSRKGVDKDERAKQIESAGRGEAPQGSERRDQDHQGLSAYKKVARDARRQGDQRQAGRRQGQGPAQQGRRRSTTRCSPRCPSSYWREIAVGDARSRASVAQDPRELQRAARARSSSRSARRSAASRRATSCRRASSRW